MFDQRGQKSPKSHRINPEIWSKLHEWIQTLPLYKSHYNYERTDRLYFEDRNLNITKLHKDFLSHMLKITGKPINLSFVTFFKYYKINFNIGFKSPRSDICDFCFEILQKGLSKLNDEQKIEYNNHLQKVERYRNFKNNCTETNSNTIVLEMDYCKTWPIPKLPNASYYYSSVLNFNLFNVHFYNINKDYMFYFIEGEFKRDPNSVCSFLFEALKYTINNSVQVIYIFSDSCPAQNKNYAVLKFLNWFSVNFKAKIIQVFPVRGHSYCSCDRNFAIFSKSLKNIEIIETSETYIETLKNCNFIVNKGISFDYKKCFESHFNSTKNMRISDSSRIEYFPNGYIKMYHDYFDIPYKETNLMLNNKNTSLWTKNLRLSEKIAYLMKNTML